MGKTAETPKGEQLPPPGVGGAPGGLGCAGQAFGGSQLSRVFQTETHSWQRVPVQGEGGGVPILPSLPGRAVREAGLMTSDRQV